MVTVKMVARGLDPRCKGARLCAPTCLPLRSLGNPMVMNSGAEMFVSFRRGAPRGRPPAAAGRGEPCPYVSWATDLLMTTTMIAGWSEDLRLHSADHILDLAVNQEGNSPAASTGTPDAARKRRPKRNSPAASLAGSFFSPAKGRGPKFVGALRYDRRGHSAKRYIV